MERGGGRFLPAAAAEPRIHDEKIQTIFRSALKLHPSSAVCSGLCSGTSFSCAAVSALCAAIWAAEPELSADEVRERLYSTAKDVGEPGFDADSGWGIVRMQPGAAEDTLAKSGSLHGLVSPDPTASANERDCRRMKKFCGSFIAWERLCGKNLSDA